MNRSLGLTLVVCLAFRLALLAVSDRLDHVPAPATDQRFLQLEQALIRGATTKPKIVLMGDSNIRYGLDEARIAAAAELRPGEVVNLGLEGGRAWDARVFLRRNPRFFDKVQLVILNVGLHQIRASSVAKRFAHFYRFSTLPEKLAADRLPDRAKLVADWIWPCYSERRNFVTWLLGLQGQSDCGNRPGHLRPAWEPRNMASLLALKKTARQSSGQVGDDPPTGTSRDAQNRPAGSRSHTGFGRGSEAEGPGPAAEPPTVSHLHEEILTAFIEHWRQAGVRLLLIGTPNQTGYWEAHRRDSAAQACQEQFKAMIDLVTGEQVAYLRGEAGSEIGLDDQADFLDDSHLTPGGAAKMTAAVVDALTERGWLPLEPTPALAQHVPLLARQ